MSRRMSRTVTSGHSASGVISSTMPATTSASAGGSDNSISSEVDRCAFWNGHGTRFNCGSSDSSLSGFCSHASSRYEESDATDKLPTTPVFRNLVRDYQRTGRYGRSVGNSTKSCFSPLLALLPTCVLRDLPLQPHPTETRDHDRSGRTARLSQ